MAKYYYQEVTESGSFADPDATQYETAGSIAELKLACVVWNDTVQRYSDSSGELLVWRGEPEGDYPCGRPYDFSLRVGTRGGVRRDL